jgi:hypothetical protein
MLHRLTRSLPFLLALALTGCVATGLDHSDAWLNEPPLHVANTADWDEIPAEKIHEILPDQLPAAASLLDQETDLQISPTQAHQLAGNFPDQPAPLYLVRALGSPIQGFHRILLTSHDGNSLLVSSGILTHHHISPQRSPIIVSLPVNPRIVYVNALEAE